VGKKQIPLLLGYNRMKPSKTELLFLAKVKFGLRHIT